MTKAYIVARLHGVATQLDEAKTLEEMQYAYMHSLTVHKEFEQFIASAESNSKEE
jgi:hypothetical protein